MHTRKNYQNYLTRVILVFTICVVRAWRDIVSCELTWNHESVVIQSRNQNQNKDEHE